MTLTQLIAATCSLVLFSLAGCGAETATNTTSPVTTAAATDITGEWTLTIDTPRGVQNPKVLISKTNGVLSGTYESFRGPIDITSVTVDGNRFSFPLVLSVPIGKIEVNYEGTIDGDRMIGLVKNPRGEVAFSGVRSGP